MDSDPHLIIRKLIDRITVIAVKSYEVESLLQPGAGQYFRRAAYSLEDARLAGPGVIDFVCRLTLQAQGAKGERLPSAYEVEVTGCAAFESPVWHINDITDVVADRIDRGDHSGFAPL